MNNHKSWLKKNSLKIRSFVVTFSLISLTGCYHPKQLISVESLRLPLPTKDEVALVNTQPLSLHEYLLIRSQLSRPSNERAIWIGISMLSLKSVSERQGKAVDRQTAYDIARYAIQELSMKEAEPSLRSYFRAQQLPSIEEVRREIDSMNQKSWVKRNPLPLSQYN